MGKGALPGPFGREITVGGLCSPTAGATMNFVPLSDDEQRILREIEAQLQTDEKFATAVSSSGLYRHSARTIRWAALGMFLCLVAVVGSLQIHYLVAFVAFIGMLACALVIERQVRLIGRAGVQDLAQSIKRPGVSPINLRDRFPRD